MLWYVTVCVLYYNIIVLDYIPTTSCTTYITLQSLHTPSSQSSYPIVYPFSFLSPTVLSPHRHNIRIKSNQTRSDQIRKVTNNIKNQDLSKPPSIHTHLLVTTHRPPPTYSFTHSKQLTNQSINNHRPANT